MSNSKMFPPEAAGRVVTGAKYVVLDETGVYEMTSNPRGLCLIINNVNYTYLGNRTGAYHDEVTLRKIFCELGFYVLVVNDQDATGIHTTLRSFATHESHNGAQCGVLIIMAHGGSGFICGKEFRPGDNHKEIKSYVTYEDIVRHLNNHNCTALKGRPKVCFIQACQGDDPDEGVVEDDATKISMNYMRRLPSVSDFFFSFAAQDGISTLRHPQSGGYYSQHLAEVLSKWACVMDLEEMLKMVERRVSSEVVIIKGKQCVLSTSFKGYGWSKRLYFNPGISKENLSFVEKRALHFEQDGEVEKLRNRVFMLQQSSSVLLSDAMTETNCLQLYDIAKNQQLPDLKKNAEIFIQNNFEKVCTVRRRVLLDLSFEDLHPLLRSENVRIENQDGLVQFLIDWVHHDIAARKVWLESVLDLVRYEKCTSRYLEHVLQSQSLIRTTASVARRIDAALQALRKNQCVFVLAGYLKRSKTSNEVEVYNTENNKWFEHQNQDAPSGMVAVFALENNTFLVISPSNTYKWNPYTFERTELLPMPERSTFCAVLLDGKVYVMGGYFKEKKHVAVSSCVVYNIELGQWSEIAAMKQKRQYASAAVLNGQVYCAGGCNGMAVLDTVEKYDPQRNQWTSVKSMQNEKSHFSLVTRGGHIYAIGGWSGTNKLTITDVEMYTPETDLWTKHSDLLTGRAGHSTVLYEQNFLVSGGYTEKGVSPETEVLRSESNVWENGPSLMVGRCVHSTCVLQYRPQEVRHRAETRVKVTPNRHVKSM